MPVVAARGWLWALALLLLPGAAAADEADFFAGKTLRIVVGFSPGGGYDTNARLVARYLGPHIAGHPTVIVDNMPGAGSVRAANYVYGVAPKDGTVIAAINVNAPMYQLLGGEGAQYDATKVQWLGSITHSNDVTYAWAATGIRTLEDAREREVLLGGVGTTSDGYIYATVMNALIGTRFKIILGYPGSNEIKLAIERGEIMGRGGASWASVLTETPSWPAEHKINMLIQIGREKERDLLDVPLLLDLVKTDEARQIAAIMSAPSSMGYSYWVAPEVPAARAKILRAAFAATMNDAAMRQDGESHGMRIAPQSAADVEANIRALAATPKPILDRTAQILGWRK
jgi:hypothetical protein